MIVHELLLRGVKHAEILATINQLRVQYGTEWPQAEAELAITLPRDDGAHRKGPAWLLAREGERYVRPSSSLDQGVLEVDVVQVAKDLERGGWIVRDLPDLHHIEVNPDRLSGRPTIRGRRIAAEDVARTALDDADGLDTLREGYELSDQEIEDAVTWWTHVLGYELV